MFPPTLTGRSSGDRNTSNCINWNAMEQVIPSPRAAGCGLYESVSAAEVTNLKQIDSSTEMKMIW